MKLSEILKIGLRTYDTLTANRGYNMNKYIAKILSLFNKPAMPGEQSWQMKQKPSNRPWLRPKKGRS